MSSRKYNLLALGSCRVCTVLNKYQNTYNTWEKVGQRDLNPKRVIGRSWSVNEQLELLRLIKGDKSFDEYVGCEYPNVEQIEGNLLSLRQEFNQLDAIVSEVSSLRYYQTKDNKLIHNVEHSKARDLVAKDASPEEFRENSKSFIDYSSKPVFFVSHFDRKSKPYREIIWNNLKQVSSGHDNVYLVDTSLMPDLKPVSDREHYTEDGEVNARKYIGSIISQALGGAL